MKEAAEAGHARFRVVVFIDEALAPAFKGNLSQGALGVEVLQFGIWS